MVVYVEYAFMENFLFDITLLVLARLSAKEPLYWWRIIFSACLGALFALLFPLLSLSNWQGTTLKIFIGFLLCILTCKQLKTKKDWGRYALIAIFFFSFSFAFGGTLLSVFFDFNSGAQNIGGGFKVGVWLGFALLSLGAKWFANKLYQRKKLYEKMYDCEVCFSDQKMSARGFLDSGNLAKKNDLPICFLSPDLFYDLFSAYILDGDGGQVCDEITLVTISGEKKTKIYLGELTLEGRKRRVYYAPSAHMIGREYNVLLHSEILEDRE